jgi:hypothetical protein
MSTEETDVTSAEISTEAVPPADPEPEVAPDGEEGEEDPLAAVEKELGKEPEKHKKPEKIDPKAEYEKKADELTRAVSKREKAVVQEREQLRIEKEKLADQRVKLESDARVQVERANQAISEARSAIKLATDDPFAFLAKFANLSFEDVARRALNGGNPSAEEMTARAQREAEEARREAKAIRDQLEAEKSQSRQQAAQRAFVDGIRKAPEFAAVSKAYKNDRELLHEAFAVGNALQEDWGRTPTDAEIAARMLERYKILAERDQTPSAGSNETAGRTAAKTSENGNGSPDSRAEATAGPTLTTKLSAQRNSIGKDLLEMTPEEEREYVLSQITKHAS